MHTSKCKHADYSHTSFISTFRSPRPLFFIYISLFFICLHSRFPAFIYSALYESARARSLQNSLFWSAPASSRVIKAPRRCISIMKFGNEEIQPGAEICSLKMRSTAERGRRGEGREALRLLPQVTRKRSRGGGGEE